MVVPATHPVYCRPAYGATVPELRSRPWVSVPESDIDRGRILLDRALVWDANDELQNLKGSSLLLQS